MERFRSGGGHKTPLSKKRLKTKVIVSYVFDYLIILILGGIFAAVDKVEPFKQRFALQNYTLQYPYAVDERIPASEALIICTGGPLVIIAVYTMIIDGLFSHKPRPTTSKKLAKWTGQYTFKDRLWELNCGILGLLLAVGAAFTITGTLKNTIGKPRPDIIDRCQPEKGSQDPPVFGLSDASICTQTDMAILNDGFKSFPSGHSSTAFAGLTYLSIYLAGKLHVLDSKGEVWKSFIVLIPILAASLVAGSRIMDARHHPFDVISGSLLGILVAWGSYRQYFPPVTEPWHKGRAYPIRYWGQEPVAPQGSGVVRTDDAAELLNAAVNGQDEEEMRSSLRNRLSATRQSWGRSPEPGSSPPLDRRSPPASGNVFRDQIAKSQRQREETRGNAHWGSERGNHGQQTWSDSSSDSESDAPEFELQPANSFAQTGTDSDAAYMASQARDYGSYGPLANEFGGDTSYHSPRAPIKAPTEGDMGVRQ